MSNESTNIIETMSAELEHLRPMEASLEMAEADIKAYKQRIVVLEKEVERLKNKADKVIAELEESHKREVGQLLIEIVKLKADYKEACDRLQTANLIKDEQLAATRHHKYKRCLAMARFCQYRSEIFFTWSKKRGFLLKWQNRWLELAEKFKEVK